MTEAQQERLKELETKLVEVEASARAIIERIETDRLYLMNIGKERDQLKRDIERLKMGLETESEEIERTKDPRELFN